MFVNEPKINVREIDCSRPMSDLKEDEQMKLHELMHNERQKRLGLPQSHEEVKTFLPFDDPFGIVA